MGRLGIRIANVLLASLCCFQVASVVNKISAAALVPDARPFAATTPEVAVPVRSWEDRQAILARNLFGAQIVDPAPAPEPEPDLEPTKLPVKLLGTVLSPDREKSHAVIESRGAPEPELLREGDPLERHPEAKVAKIERRRVVLKNGKRYEELLLWEELEPLTPTAASQPPPRRVARRTPSRSAYPASTSVPSIVEQLQQLRAGGIGGRTAQDLLSQARITPYFEDGEMAGMEVRDIVPGSLYEKIGLSDGDVIESFNGIKLDSDGAGAQILGQLGQADEYEIVLSDGSTKTVRSGDIQALMGSRGGAGVLAGEAD